MTARSALITGGSRGIGAAIAMRLATEGYDLTLAARSRGPLDELAASLRDEHRVTVHTFAGTMATDENVEALAAAHEAAFGQLDVLVLNAGVGSSAPFESLPDKTFNLMLDLNLRSPHRLIQLCLPMLRKAAAAHPDRGARVLALSSISGVAAESGLAVYGATKAALISLCEGLTVEESANGVSATALSPGYVDTDMSAWKHGDLGPEDMLRAEDIAELAVAITHLSARATVPNIVITRGGEQLWRA